MGSLWGEFGHVACKVGAAEGDGVASLQLNSAERLDEAFSTIGNATASLATQEAKVGEMMQVLLDALKYYLELLGEIKKTFEVRADALIEYQSACSKYEEQEAKFSGSVASQASDGGTIPASEAAAGEMSVAGAAGHRDECKRRYELICSRMKAELARVYVEQTEALNSALHRFVTMQAQHSAYTAAAWDKVIPGCGTIQLLPGVTPVNPDDASLATDDLSSIMHKGLNAMGLTKNPI
uniref:Sorting nexin/Vps5-like C-terminal domain-containing protein n=1 Tax=Pyramimonas obovata TaxID=1411642 RepID=A0A7S0MS71_9CHLO|mmetsp:Transcript_1187/g.2350  ORF Transcript_1187/g.2350 Transcript_1187/m.2350 type:complete len:238 (+) Transcript_1187:2-715(+)